MFTGIIQAVGFIEKSQKQGGDCRLSINTQLLDLADVALGDSIATNGVCLTVVELLAQGFVADVSLETLAYTTLGEMTAGRRVNLEKALRAQDRLGGHLVSGHVDGVGEVMSFSKDARSIRYTVKAPKNLAKYIAFKGSICVDGTSLTVNAVHGSNFELNIVPHTLQETIFNDYKVGTKLNLEVDVIARYLERLLQGDNAAEEGPLLGNTLTLETLQKNGFTGS